MTLLIARERGKGKPETENGKREREPPRTRAYTVRMTPLRSALAGVVLLGAALLPMRADSQALPEWTPLFNGRDLTGWVNVNTAEDTWQFKDDLLVCSGRPIGVLCSERQYENFILHIEWRHMEPGGNSGVFVWSSARPDER